MAQPRTIEQGRAQKAYEFAKDGTNDGKNKEYKNKVKSFPMMVKTNGLGAAVAFINGKKDKDWTKIYSQLKGYLEGKDLFITPKEGIKLKDTPLDSYLTQIDSSLYRAITVEVMALFTWLRRFAEGFDNKID